jgi:cytosine/uracil/thiamine/allantoin permease
MAEQRGGFGKFVLYVVLGVLGVFIGIQVIQWVFSWLGWAIIIGVTAGVAYLVVKGVRRSVTGGQDRRQLPR